MDLHFLIEGIIIGIAISVPLGPLGMLCIQRTVNKNWESGLVSGIAISLADAVYATIAGFSLTLIINFITTYEIYFKIIGLIVMILLGIYIFSTNPAKEVRKFQEKGTTYLQDFLTAFIIALSNALAIFIFLAIFSSYSIVLRLSKFGEAILIIGGIFIGGVLWWVVLTGFANMFRHKFTFGMLEWANKIIGASVILIAIILFFILQKEGI